MPRGQSITPSRLFERRDIPPELRFSFWQPPVEAAQAEQVRVFDQDGNLTTEQIGVNTFHFRGLSVFYLLRALSWGRLLGFSIILYLSLLGAISLLYYLWSYACGAGANTSMISALYFTVVSLAANGGYMGEEQRTMANPSHVCYTGRTYIVMLCSYLNIIFVGLVATLVVSKAAYTGSLSNRIVFSALCTLSVMPGRTGQWKLCFRMANMENRQALAHGNLRLFCVTAEPLKEYRQQRRELKQQRRIKQEAAEAAVAASMPAATPTPTRMHLALLVPPDKKDAKHTTKGATVQQEKTGTTEAAAVVAHSGSREGRPRQTSATREQQRHVSQGTNTPAQTTTLSTTTTKAKEVEAGGKSHSTPPPAHPLQVDSVHTHSAASGSAANSQRTTQSGSSARTNTSVSTSRDAQFSSPLLDEEHSTSLAPPQEKTATPAISGVGSYGAMDARRDELAAVHSEEMMGQRKNRTIAFGDEANNATSPLGPIQSVSSGAVWSSLGDAERHINDVSSEASAILPLTTPESAMMERVRVNVSELHWGCPEESYLDHGSSGQLSLWYPATITHVIDERSPLFRFMESAPSADLIEQLEEMGDTEARAQALRVRRRHRRAQAGRQDGIASRKFQIVAVFSATEMETGATIMAKHTYTTADIVAHSKFSSKLVHMQPHRGGVLLDYHYFNEVLPISAIESSTTDSDAE